MNFLVIQRHGSPSPHRHHQPVGSGGEVFGDRDPDYPINTALIRITLRQRLDDRFQRVSVTNVAIGQATLESRRWELNPQLALLQSAALPFGYPDTRS